MLLPLASVLLQTVNGLRRSLYRAGVLRAKRLPKPVISVGNIAAGGAGKTPAVIAIARDLSSRGVKVAVLTRGYGRAADAPDGLMTEPDAARWGDEPSLIKKSAPNVDVIVGSKRHENAVAYLTVNSCDCFILDDGFQHLQLHRDLDVVIDVKDASVSRESRGALRDAGIVIERSLRPRIPADINGKRVFAFSALANNDQFFDSLRAAGVNVVGTRAFADHYRYTSEDLDAIGTAAGAAGAEAIVTTEKDKVKIDRRDMIAIPAEFAIDRSILDRIYAAVRR